MMRTYFEKNLQLAQENDINIFLTVITGGNSNPVQNRWVNEMFDKYSCLKGLVATENWYGGDDVPNNMADYLEAAAEKGGYFVWTDANLSDHAMERWMDIDKLYDAAVRYSDNFIICSKSTASSGFANVRSVGMGYWLSDLCSNWGALTDSWYWYEKGYWRLFDQSEAPYRTMGGGYANEEVRCPFQFPETMYSINMLQTYANGGVVFNFEHPFYCTGVNDIPSHALTEAILPVMEYIIDHPAPTKETVTEAAKVVFSSGEGYMPSDFQYGLYGDQYDGNLLQSSGRYNTIPIIYKNVDESILERFDAVIDFSDIEGMTTEEKAEWFDQYYPAVSEKPALQITGEAGRYEYQESYDEETGAYILTVDHNGQVSLSLREEEKSGSEETPGTGDGEQKPDGNSEADDMIGGNARADEAGSTPKTGDNISAAGIRIIAVMAAALAVIGVVLVQRKNNKGAAREKGVQRKR